MIAPWTSSSSSASLACSSIAVYTNLGGRAYRDPVIALVAGLLVAAVAAALKGCRIAFKARPGNPWSGEPIDMAVSLVDLTLFGLAGGMIGAALMPRMHKSIALMFGMREPISSQHID